MLSQSSRLENYLPAHPVMLHVALLEFLDSIMGTSACNRQHV